MSSAPTPAEKFMNIIRLCATALVLSAFASTAATTVSNAQSYPANPIVLVNPYAAGGPADALARPIAAAMGDSLGQQVVILNKPGAATAIAALHVARAPADGYTLLLSTASAHIVTPALTPKINYDGMRDFTFVAMIASVPNVLVARATLPASNVKELTALAKQKPGELSYGSVGNGSQPHLAAELFQQMAGVKLNHIPYKGAAPATTDLLSGQIDLAFLNVPALLPHIASGKLRALAATTMKRPEQLPEVPTLNELGLRGFDVATWYGITAPASTPPAVVDRLAGVLAKVLATPEMKARFAAQGTEVFLLPPKEFAAYVQADAKRLTDLIKSANIQGE
jgi:tripartite-type tricarboxylate transporter receptor subunit TctC